MRNRDKLRAGGFTLVELLVVIAIIGTLMALLLPAVQMAREAGRRASCINNLRQIGIAIHHYHEVNGAFPPGGMSPGPCCSADNYTSWTIQILPFLEQKALYDTYDQFEANESRLNQPIVQTFVPVYSCPSDINPKQLDIPFSGPAHDFKLKYRAGAYRGMGGRADPAVFAYWDVARKMDPPRKWRGVFHVVDKKFQPESFACVSDGLSNTIMVGEYCTRQSKLKAYRSLRTYWAYTHGSYNRSDAVPESRTLLPDYDRCAEMGGQGDFEPCNRAWGSFHPEVVNFLLADASVHTFTVTMDMNVFAEAATIAGKEFAPLP